MDTLELIRRRDALLEDFGRGAGLKKLGNGRYGLRCKELEQQIDKTRMSVACTITTQDPDRSKDIVITAGGDLTNHKRNPVVLLNHGFGFDTTSLPIGVAQDPDGNYTVALGQGKGTSVTWFTQNLLEAVQAFALIDEGVLRGCSIGFIPKESEYRRDQSPDDFWPGLCIVKWELFEYSHVTVPDNPNALVDRIGDGTKCLVAGKPLAPAILKSLQPYLPAMPVRVFVPAEAPASDPNVTTKGNDMSTPTPTTPAANPNPVPQAPPAGTTKGNDPTTGNDFVPLSGNQTVEGDKAKTKGDGDDMELSADQSDWPAGAKVLIGLYDRKMETCDFISKSYKSQENPKIKDALDEDADHVEKRCAEYQSLWETEYPDLPKLGDDGDLEEGDGEKDLTSDVVEDKDLTSDVVGKSRLPPQVKLLEQRVAAYRKALLARNGQLKRMTVSAKAACDSAAACLLEIAASKGELKEALKTHAQTSANALRSLAAAGGTALESESIEKLKAENAQLKVLVGKQEKQFERIRSEFSRARRGR